MPQYSGGERTCSQRVMMGRLRARYRCTVGNRPPLKAILMSLVAQNYPASCDGSRISDVFMPKKPPLSPLSTTQRTVRERRVDIKEIPGVYGFKRGALVYSWLASSISLYSTRPGGSFSTFCWSYGGRTDMCYYRFEL